MSRLLTWLLIVPAFLLVGLAAVAVGMRFVVSDPAEWHVDLQTAERTGEPNDFLAATPGYTTANIDTALAPGPAAGFLQAIADAALGEPRTEILAGAPEEGRITFVQRSAVFGFPDYVTVQAEGENRAIWSRSRYGRSDFGVNAKRTERWLAALNR